MIPVRLEKAVPEKEATDGRDHGIDQGKPKRNDGDQNGHRGLAFDGSHDTQSGQHVS